METITKTKELIHSMLVECTGVHMCDSGFANGRHWQRNANKTIEDFENEPAEQYEYAKDSNEIFRTLSVYHYLKELELNDICNDFNKLNTNPKDWDAAADVYGVSVAAWDNLTEFNDVDISRSWNTYNGDSDLSQTLQGSNLTINDEEYILIQIHGGADGRGGYTDAMLFKLDEYGLIHEYLREYIDLYDLLDELEYIDSIVDYWDNSIIYKGKELKAIKNKLKTIKN